MSDIDTQQAAPIEAELVGDDLELLTVQEVADLFRVPAKWVYAKAASGELPSIKIGVYRRFRRTDLRRFVDSSTSVDEEEVHEFGRTEPELIRRPRRPR